jgi:predicted phage terminase large subunit-like protein
MTTMDPKLKALLLQDFLSFARKAIFELDGTRIGKEPYLRYLADELDQFAEEKTRRLVINLPPGHLKTMLGSVCTTAWLLAKDPHRKVIVVAHAEHLSKTIARYVRTILEAGWFKGLFTARIKRGHAEVTDFGTTAGGGVFVTSFGGRFTGRRADVIVVDDPHDIGDGLEEIKKTIESFNTVLLSRLNNRRTGRVLVVAHRVHEQDLSASLLRKKKWNFVVLPMQATRDQTYKTSSGIWRRRKGELLRSEAFDPEDLDELRRNTFNPSFDMLYQQDCDAQALPAFRADHFPTITELMPPSAPIVLSVDAGMTQGRKNAFSVVQVWRVNAKRFYLLDQFREQCDYSELRRAVNRLRKRYRPSAILIERAANGNALISDLSRKHRKLVIAIDPDGRSKSARLRAHAETIIAKRIHLPAEVPWRDDFVEEFVEFPRGKFTDQVDATTQLLDRADELARLEPRPARGGAVLAGNSMNRQKTITPSPTESTPGLIAGTHSDGRRMTGRHPSKVSFPYVKTKVRY